MKKLLFILLCLPMIGFGQTTWTPCDSSFSININSQNSIEVVYSVSGPNLNMNSNPSWVYFNMLGSCIGGSSNNSQTDTVNINNNLPDSTAIMCLITDSLSSCIVTDTLVFDSLSGWFFTSNQSLGCTDIIACNYDALATINDGSCIYINISVSVSDVSCYGYSNGGIFATATGGATPNYQYSIGGVSQTNGTFSNLNTGTYFIDVTDINGCSSNQTVTISEPNPLFVNLFQLYVISCFSYCDGSAIATPSGGTPPYSYLWSNGNITDITTGLCSGVYSVNITDANNCNSNDTTAISEPLPLVSNNTINGCDSVLIGINYYTISGAYTDTLTSVNGCDSVVNTNLTIGQNTSLYDTLSVGASIVWNGMPLNVSGDYSATLINSVGCDSIVNLNLTVTITGMSEIVNNKSKLLKITDMLGQETPYRRNTPLFYIYDDGTLEKKLIFE